MKEVKDKSNSLNVLDKYIKLVFMLKVLNIPRYIYNEFRNDFLSCHPERSSMHMHVSNKFSYDLYYRVLVEI